MPNNQVVSLEIVEKVALALEEINDEVIYVGGAVIGLYVNDEGAEEPRPTRDIDVSVKISSYSQMEELRVKLADKRIYPAQDEEILYRYTYENILIDFIPFEETPLGPTNRWLKPGFEKAYSVQLKETQIRILPVSLFLATKWEAFMSRGNDPRTSHDFEDIIYVLDNNVDVIDDVKNAEKDVQDFLEEMSNYILSHSSTNEIIECHLSLFSSNERREMVITKLENI